MNFVMPTSEELIEAGSNPISVAGPGHYVVTFAESPVENKEGQVVPDLECKLKLECVNHLDPSQIGKDLWLTLRKPKPSDNDQGKFANNLLARTALATNVLPNAKPGQAVEVHWANMVGNQACVVTFRDEWENDEGKVRHSFKLEKAKIWHPKDPKLPEGFPLSQPKLAECKAYGELSGKPTTAGGAGAIEGATQAPAGEAKADIATTEAPAGTPSEGGIFGALN